MKVSVLQVPISSLWVSSGFSYKGMVAYPSYTAKWTKEMARVQGKSYSKTVL